MPLDDASVAALADALLDAERDQAPIDQPSATHPGMDVGDAYRVQRTITDRRMAEGERIVGWKVGLTSRVMQQLLGVDQPDVAAILSGWALEDGAAIPRAALIATPRRSRDRVRAGLPAARPGRDRPGRAGGDGRRARAVVRLGRRKVVRGQEDMIVDVAMELAKRT